MRDGAAVAVGAFSRANRPRRSPNGKRPAPITRRDRRMTFKFTFSLTTYASIGKPVARCGLPGTEVYQIGMSAEVYLYGKHPKLDVRGCGEGNAQTIPRWPYSFVGARDWVLPETVEASVARASDVREAQASEPVRWCRKRAIASHRA